MRQQSYVFALATAGLRCRPEQRVERVLPERREQSVYHLEEKDRCAVLVQGCSAIGTSSTKSLYINSTTHEKERSLSLTVKFVRMLTFIFVSEVTYLKHIEKDVKLDDGLPTHDVVHHRHIYVVHHEDARNQNKSLEKIAQLRRLKNPAFLPPASQ